MNEPIDAAAAAWQAVPPDPALTSWQPPKPLIDGGEPMPFPLATAFPESLGALAEYCKGLAQEVQVPVDLPAMLVPAVTSVCIAQKFVIELHDGYRENTPIWSLVLLPSGERKSATFRRVMDPVHEWEKEEAERLAPEISAARERRELMERDRAEARRKAGTGDTESRDRAVELAKQIDAAVLPSPPSLVATDVTSEALVGMMVSNGERALVASPEGDALDVMMGRYDEKARPNLGIWLKGHSGDRVRVHRRGREPEYLDGPMLSIAMTVQPEAVRGTFSSRVAHGRGLLARFMTSVPTGKIGYRVIQPTRVAEGLEMSYIGAIRRLLGLPLDASMGPRVVRLSPGAALAFIEFQKEVEADLRLGGDLGDRREWGAKLCGAIARIALGLYCLEQFGNGTRYPGELAVGPEVMRAAISWAPYLKDHQRRATAVVGCDPETVVAERILGWLTRAGVQTFSLRDSFTACRGLFAKKVAEFEPAIDLLIDLGYIRPVRYPTESKSGRPSSPEFEVNPRWDRSTP